MTRHYVLAVALFLCVVPGKAQTDGDCLADTLLGPLPSSPVGEEEPIATEITSPAGEDGRGLLGMGLHLRANLLRWLTLTPNFGVEYHIRDRWSVMADYTWGNYTFGSRHHRYALSEAAAEVRCNLARRAALATAHMSPLPPRAPYLGLYLVGGQFNYRLTASGRQGHHFGIGLSAGYQLPLSRHWQFDFGAAAGWLCILGGERHRWQDGLSVWRSDFSRSTLLPLSLRATLVYVIPRRGNKSNPMPDADPGQTLPLPMSNEETGSPLAVQE